VRFLALARAHAIAVGEAPEAIEFLIKVATIMAKHLPIEQRAVVV
jgi:hypothetical protein